MAESLLVALPGGRLIPFQKLMADRNGTRAALSVREAAQRLGIPAARVRDLCRSGKLAASRDGKAWLIRPEALEAYLDTYRFEPARHGGPETHMIRARRLPVPRLDALPERGKRGRRAAKKSLD